MLANSRNSSRSHAQQVGFDFWFLVSVYRVPVKVGHNFEVRPISFKGTWFFWDIPNPEISGAKHGVKGLALTVQGVEFRADRLG